MDILDMELSGVWPLSQGAVSAAREYVSLVEAQLAKAHADMRASALAECEASPDSDEADHQSYVGAVDRAFERDYRPIMRFTEVVYLYMIFETYVRRHVAEIHELRHDSRDILKVLPRMPKRGFVRAARTYLRDDAGLHFFNEREWGRFQDLAYLRNCIIHNGGVARDSTHRKEIYALESRIWQGQPVGITIDRYQGRDLGEPITIDRRFIEYSLDLLVRFFDALAQAVEVKFRNEKNS